MDADKGVLNTFVYVKDGLDPAYTFDTPTAPAVLDQKGCAYTPRVLGVRVGQAIEVVNSDPTLHNVHALPMTNREFNHGQPRQNTRLSEVFTTPEVMVRFKCDVHGWMAAWVGVVAHPYFAVSDEKGEFKLPGLPPGSFTLEAWHEKLGKQTAQVDRTEPDAIGPIAFTALPQSNEVTDLTLPRAHTKVDDLVLLTKIRLNALVVATTAGGYYMAAPPSINVASLLVTCLGTALVASGASAFNQVDERDLDRLMVRTRLRPLADGRMGAGEGRAIAGIFAIAGLLILWFGANAIAALVAPPTLLSYTLIYTPLKRRSSLDVVSAVPRALPPLIGWCAARGDVGGAVTAGMLANPAPWALFLLMFLAAAALPRDRLDLPRRLRARESSDAAGRRSRWTQHRSPGRALGGDAHPDQRTAVPPQHDRPGLRGVRARVGTRDACAGVPLHDPALERKCPRAIPGLDHVPPTALDSHGGRQDLGQGRGQCHQSSPVCPT